MDPGPGHYNTNFNSIEYDNKEINFISSHVFMSEQTREPYGNV